MNPTVNNLGHVHGFRIVSIQRDGLLNVQTITVHRKRLTKRKIVHHLTVITTHTYSLWTIKNQQNFDTFDCILLVLVFNFKFEYKKINLFIYLKKLVNQIRRCMISEANESREISKLVRTPMSIKANLQLSISLVDGLIPGERFCTLKYESDISKTR